MVTRRPSRSRPTPTPPRVFNRIVELQEFTSTRDNFGSIIESWATVDTVWASVNQTGVSEKFKNDANRKLALRTAQIEIRWRSDIEETWRVIYDGLIWDIKGQAQIGRRQGLNLFCQTDVNRPFVP